MSYEPKFKAVEMTTVEELMIQMYGSMTKVAEHIGEDRRYIAKIINMKIPNMVMMVNGELTLLTVTPKRAKEIKESYFVGYNKAPTLRDHTIGAMQ